MATIADLAVVIDRLSPKSREFAQSLIDQSARRALSDKQLYWVNKLVTDANQPKPEAPKAEVGNLDSVIALFDSFTKKKSPAVHLILSKHRDAANGRWVVDEEIRVSRYGANSKYAGQIKVASHTHFEMGMYGPQGVWYGTIQRDGTFTGSRKHNALFPAISELLVRFAAAPAQVAGEDGKIAQRCCFCALPLSDLRSSMAGYGETCAKNHGLPYPTKKEAEAFLASADHVAA